MKRYDTEKAVYEAADILEELVSKKYHEYFVAAAPVEHGERYAKHFIVSKNASPSAVIAMVAEAIMARPSSWATSRRKYFATSPAESGSVQRR